MAAGSPLGLARALAGSCHPGPVAAVTTMSVLYSKALRLSTPATIEIAGAVLAGQLSIGWQNDAIDHDRDQIARRGDKPSANGKVTEATLWTASVLAGAACIPLSLASGRRPGTTHLLAVASGIAYNLGLKATPASVVPYLVSFGLLPSFVHLRSNGRSLPPWWIVTAASLLGAGAHAVNTLPDLETDLDSGVLGLPHRLGRLGSLRLMGACLVAATAVLAVAGDGPVRLRAGAGLASLALVGAAVGSGRHSTGSRRPFHLVLAIALVDVALLLGQSRLDS